MGGGNRGGALVFEGNCVIGKRGKGPAAGGELEGGGGGTEGPLKWPGGADNENGVDVKGGAGGVGLKKGGSDSTMVAVDEKDAIPCAASKGGLERKEDRPGFSVPIIYANTMTTIEPLNS